MEKTRKKRKGKIMWVSSRRFLDWRGSWEWNEATEDGCGCWSGGSCTIGLRMGILGGIAG